MSPSARSLVAPLFLISTAVLTQELLLLRLLAVPLWHHLTTMVVTSALLAFGVAGTVLAVMPRLGGHDAPSARSWFGLHCQLFAASTFLVGRFLSQVDLDTVNLLRDPLLAVQLFGLYLLVGLPLFFAGLAVATALRQAGPGLPRLYFANLIGSGAGCVLFLVLLGPLSGPDLLVATALLGVVAALWACRRRGHLLCGLVLGVAATSSLVSPEVGRLAIPPLRPVTSKVINRYLAAGHRVETSIWSPLCRIDVTADPASGPRGPRLLFQDGDAPAFIEPPDAPEAAEVAVPYLVHPRARSILVIGAGGGRELAAAVRRGLERIVGLEVNATTARLLRGPYRELTGNLAEHPGLELVHAEGRAWLARSDERFDFIQMTGVDTYTALSSGAYVASESYLYTAEAFDAYLEHLNPDGCFSIIRLFFTPDRETLRLFVMALDALQRRGVADPGSHALVIRVGAWGILVVGRSPIPAARMQDVRALVRASHSGEMGEKISLQHDPEQNLETPFAAYAKAVREGTTDRFLAGYPYDVGPVTDDDPFFYLYFRWGAVIQRLLGLSGSRGEPGTGSAAEVADEWLVNTGEVPVGQLVLLFLLLQSVVVGAILVLGPLLVFRHRALALPGRSRTVLLFGSLGLGFMLLEIALAQKLALFLGHPVYSLSVVIGGLLLFSGLGSLASGRLPARVALVIGCLGAAFFAGASALALPRLTTLWLSAGDAARIGAALGMLAPLGLLLGMPMPSGLRLLGERGRDLVPWAWGVNAVASVLGSILAIILAMQISFEGVLWTAGGLYLVAAFCRLPRLPPAGSGPAA